MDCIPVVGKRSEARTDSAVPEYKPYPEDLDNSTREFDSDIVQGNLAETVVEDIPEVLCIAAVQEQ